MSGQAVPLAAVGRRSVVLFACGNKDRGDDAVAIAAVARLAPEVLTLATIRSVEAVELEALVEVPADAAVLVVDAVAGPAPGSIIDVAIEELEQMSGHVVATSTHQLPLDRLVAIAGIIRGEPIHGRFVGVGVADTSAGAPISAAAIASVPHLCRVIEAAIRDLRRVR